MKGGLGQSVVQDTCAGDLNDIWAEGGVRVTGPGEARRKEEDITSPARTYAKTRRDETLKERYGLVTRTG